MNKDHRETPQYIEIESNKNIEEYQLQKDDVSVPYYVK